MRTVGLRYGRFHAQGEADMIRDFIQRVRPELRPMTPRLYLPSVERQEYVAGWRWGVICGMVVASTAFLIARAL